MTLYDSYWMEAQWGARVETPAALADRFLRTIDAISSLHPLLDTWTWGDSQEVWETEGQGGTYPFAEIRPNIVHAIEKNVCNGGEGVPDPFYGYLMMTQTDRTPEGSSIGLAVSASKGVNGGSTVSAFCNNYATLDIGPDPDPSLITFALWRSLLLILCETWEATWAEASPEGIRSEWRGIPVRCAWMNYVSPRFAPLITPPPAAIVEHRPNGGLFLAATDEPFQMANPSHLAVAREIEAALQPLNQIAWPIDDPYT